MTTATIGSISHGTLRNQDLLPAFFAELDHLTSRAAELVDVADWQTADGNWLDDDDESWDDEETSESIMELADCLDDQAPEYCYFGCLEGDGSDFGYWPDMVRIEQETADGILVPINDPAELDSLDDDNAVFINDHGNVTIFARTADGWQTVAEFV